MKKNKKNVMLFSALAALALSCGVGVVSVNASAADGVTVPVITATSFAVQEGASILATGGGIRFKASISKSDLQTVRANYETVEFGMMICPTDYLTAGVTLDFDETDGLVLKTETSTTNYFSATMCSAEETESGYEYHGSLTDILESNYSRPFTGRAFLRCSNAGEETEYIYTENSYSRSIYTVATYAVNDTKAGYSTQMLNSVYGIIDTVQAVYNDFNISVTDKDGNAVENVAHGDVVKIKATVSDTDRALKNGTTAKTLEVCPTITTTGDSGVTRLQAQADGTYKVLGMGDFTYSASSGKADAENTLQSGVQSVSCATQIQVLGGADTLGNLKQNPNTLIEYVGDYNQQVGFNKTSKKDVFTFKNKDATNTKMSDNSFSFSDDITAQMTAGTFLYFDMFIPSCAKNILACRIDVQLSGSYGPQIMYNNANKNTVNDALYFQMYKTSGEKMTTSLWAASTDRDTWIRIELKLPANWNNELMYIGSYNTANTDGVYLSNIILSQTQLSDLGAVATTSETTITMLNKDVSADDGHVGFYTTADSGSSLVWDDAMGGYKWTELVAGNDGRAAIDLETRKYLTAGTYIYLDVYTTHNSTFCVYANGEIGYMMYSNVTGTTSSGTTWTIYDRDTKKPVSSAFWNGGCKGKWVTIEICLGAAMNASQDNAATYNGFALYGSQNMDEDGFAVYVNNYIASKTSLINANN